MSLRGKGSYLQQGSCPLRVVRGHLAVFDRRKGKRRGTAGVFARHATRSLAIRNEIGTDELGEAQHARAALWVALNVENVQRAALPEGLVHARADALGRTRGVAAFRAHVCEELKVVHEPVHELLRRRQHLGDRHAQRGRRRSHVRLGRLARKLERILCRVVRIDVDRELAARDATVGNGFVVRRDAHDFDGRLLGPRLHEHVGRVLLHVAHGALLDGRQAVVLQARAREARGERNLVEEACDDLLARRDNLHGDHFHKRIAFAVHLHHHKLQQWRQIGAVCGNLRRSTDNAAFAAVRAESLGTRRAGAERVGRGHDERRGDGESENGGAHVWSFTVSLGHTPCTLR
eukprot:Opistho-1_new@48471